MLPFEKAVFQNTSSAGLEINEVSVTLDQKKSNPKSKCNIFKMRKGEQSSFDSEKSNYASHILFSRKFSEALKEPVAFLNQRRTSKERKKHKKQKPSRKSV